MFRKLFSLALTGTFFIQAAEAKAPALKFREDGEFKIVQFTDMHICEEKSEYRTAELMKTYGRLSRIINQERPDLIVLTGDIVTDGNRAKGWERILDTLNKYQIPFCYMNGNHDPERYSRTEIASFVVSSPYSLNELNKAGELADMEIEVLSSKDNKVASLLYCLDSRDYSTLEHVKGYGWSSIEQVSWLRNSCLKRTKDNGGAPVNSLAFFHICLPEYSQAWDNPKKNSKGRAAENECPGALNTGMFAAMVETASVMGVFVGHDHDNDYVVADNGVALGYGRFSGDDTTYNNLRPGVRVIVLEEGQRAFRSWIIEDDGRVVDRMKFADGRID
jgi:predicted phosphodiesterase